MVKRSSDEDGAETRVSNGARARKLQPAPLLADDDHDNEDPDIPRHRPSNEPLPENERGFGRYTLLRRLAYGGMGEIFLARQGGGGALAELAKLVVIKRILSHMRRDEKHRRMFLDEARLQALLNNPHVVAIYDMGEEAGHVYLAMEHVHGPSLRAVIDRCRQLGEEIPVAHVANIVAQAARGLSYAHNLVDVTGQQLRIVHRDINPHNVLASYDGEVKIIDFGIAKSELGSGNTETGTIKGKFQYMSPEQSAAEHLDKRSDLFTLGICLYELLTLENPFRRQNVVLSLEAIQKEQVPPIERRRLDARALSPIVDRLLAKHRADRYSDGAELAEALEEVARSGLLAAPAAPLPVWLRERFTTEIAEHLQILEATGSSGQAVSRSPSDPAGFPRRRHPPSRVEMPPLEERTDPSIHDVRDFHDPSLELEVEMPADEVTRSVATDGPPTFTNGPTTLPGPLPHDLTASTPAPARLPDEQDEPRRRPLLWAAISLVTVGVVCVGAFAGMLWWRPALLESLPPSVQDRLAFLRIAPVDEIDLGPAPHHDDPVVDPNPPATDAGPAPLADAGVAPVVVAPVVPPVAPSADKPEKRRRDPPKDKEPARTEPVKDAVGTLLVTTEGFSVKGGRKLPKGGSTTLKIGGDGAPYTVTLKVTDVDGVARVQVSTDPWAVVTANSSSKGRTPQTLDLAAGKRTTLSLKNPTAGSMELSIQLAGP